MCLCTLSSICCLSEKHCVEILLRSLKKAIQICVSHDLTLFLTKGIKSVEKVEFCFLSKLNFHNVQRYFSESDECRKFFHWKV